MLKKCHHHFSDIKINKYAYILFFMENGVNIVLIPEVYIRSHVKIS